MALLKPAIQGREQRLREAYSDLGSSKKPRVVIPGA